MTCCKFWTQERCTRSECMVIFKNLRKRIISRVTVFKITQLVSIWKIRVTTRDCDNYFCNDNEGYSWVDCELIIIYQFLASAGMGIHVFQPSYVTMVDSTLVPAVLGAYIIISGVLFVGHLLNCGAPTRLVRGLRTLDMLNLFLFTLV